MTPTIPKNPMLTVIPVSSNKKSDVHFTLASDTQHFLGYNKGVLKIISDRLEPNTRVAACPIALKQYNIKTAYKAHLMSRLHHFVEDWKRFFEYDSVTIGVTHPDYVQAFEQAIEEVLEKAREMVNNAQLNQSA